MHFAQTVKTNDPKCVFLNSDESHDNLTSCHHIRRAFKNLFLEVYVFVNPSIYEIAIE